MRASTVYDSSLIQLPKTYNQKGNITAINNLEGIIPFTIDRVYYLYDIPGGEGRGGHAHKSLKQLIIAASGSFALTLADGTTKQTFNLSKPYFGLYMPAGLWRELHNFSSSAICLVLASEKYDEDDYIRSEQEFNRYKQNHDSSAIRRSG
ncbi:FdtA/QdtA family cupin domain-containing protein [Aliifodinibius sp. S!AR15-10]|uniref:sugar 3,4-ketoisomerase n=1 Tax=Aliifodinibius sp. S!AR15-10 TaxID=2950437 RepID=UPI0028642D95|nr:FdtA/QdtA family cupin domain-containing protein [Aliifodinibius sp. S!AR15-10]MDR8393032.1 FdtA/QdtA family cupin domain-containing protein [Aliifodinibius sp. S!AR15-10]